MFDLSLIFFQWNFFSSGKLVERLHKCTKCSKKTKIKKRNKYCICRQPLKVAQLYLYKLKLLFCWVVRETSLSRDYASVSTAINGASNGQNAVATRPHAAIAIAPSSKSINISFHLLYRLLF